MKNVALLMKLDMILHGKSLWRMKWQFLFFAFLFAAVLAFAIHQPPKLFHITYFNEDATYGSRLAIDNFISALKGIAEMKEEQELPQNPVGDAFILFPSGFAEKWQHFEKFPAQVTILTKNPIYQALLAESFQAYENILLASESVILAYNNELDRLNLTPEQWTNANIQISLDFLSMAFHRDLFFENIPMQDLPAALTKTYAYFSFSLFLGLFLSIFWNTSEIERRQQYQRFFISRITATQYFLANLILSIVFCVGYAFLLWRVAEGLAISVSLLYPVCFAVVLLAVNLLLRLGTYFFKSEADFIVIATAVLFVFALLGGVFLPISFLPSAWAEVVQWTPFYRLFLFLTEQSMATSWVGILLWLVAAVLFAIADREILRRMKYV